MLVLRQKRLPLTVHDLCYLTLDERLNQLRGQASVGIETLSNADQLSNLRKKKRLLQQASVIGPNGLYNFAIEVVRGRESRWISRRHASEILTGLIVTPQQH